MHRPSTAELVEALVKTWSHSAAPSTVETRYRILTSVFRAAVADRRIATSPCVGVSLPRRTKPKVVPVETEVVLALADAVPERTPAMVTLAAGTGMRLGKVLGLTVDRIDFLRRTLTVDRQVVTIGGRTPTFGPPKTEASLRVIPMPQVVVEALAEHVRRFPPGEHGPVFTGAQGQPIRRHTFAMAWSKAARAAGTDATFHAMRHYVASLLIRHGESVKSVQARLGHRTAVETLDTWATCGRTRTTGRPDAVDFFLGNVADSVRTPRSSSGQTRRSARSRRMS